MKNILFVVLTALSFTSYAQLYVQPTATDASFIYANDTYIYVEKDVELETNNVTGINNSGIPNILLRNQAQLLQGVSTGTDQLNKGNGIISLFQEGTTNQFDYNLWASPVGVPVNDDGTTRAPGNGIFAFRDPGTTSAVSVTQQVFFVPADPDGPGPLVAETNSNPALHAFGANGFSGVNQLNIASLWIYGYESGDATADFIPVQDTGFLLAGRGFTMKGVAGNDPTTAGTGVDNSANNLGIQGDGQGQRIDFRGRANNGDITATVLRDTQTITGNPYPSALDLNYFLLLNSDSGTTTGTLVNGETVSFTGSDVTDGMAYFWDSDPNAQTHFIEEYQAGYGVYSPMGLLETDGMYVAAQFLMYDEDGEPITAMGPLGDDYDRRFSPIGQGFTVIGSDTQPIGNDTFTFTNDMRIFIKEGNNSDFRNSSNNEVVEGKGVGFYYEDVTNFPAFSQFKIGININDTYGRELGVGIVNHATRGYDTAMDAKGGSDLTDVTFSINEQDGFVINAVPEDEYQALQLSINAETPSEFRFRARNIIEYNYEGIYLFDTLTEIYYDIQNESILIQLPAGEYPKRFEIRFTREIEIGINDDQNDDDDDQDDANDQDDNDDNGDWGDASDDWDDEQNGDVLSIETESILETFSIIQNNNANQLEILNPNNISLTNVSLFDMTGKQIFLHQNLGSQSVYTFPTGNLSTGIYVVSFTTDDGFKKSRKISVTNR